MMSTTYTFLYYYCDLLVVHVAIPLQLHDSDILSLFKQRKFCRELGEQARDNTYYRFRQWLQSSFNGGVPSEQQMDAMMEEDREATNQSAEIGQAGDRVSPRSPALSRSFSFSPSPLNLDDDELSSAVL